MNRGLTVFVYSTLNNSDDGTINMKDTLDSEQRSQARNTQRYATIDVSFFRWELETADSA